MKKFLTILFVPILIIIGIGYLLPEFKEMPCGTAGSYNPQIFWHWPWTRGTSGHPHTGVDIFGKIGTPARCQSGGLLCGSLALFAILCVIMYFTRNQGTFESRDSME